MADAQGLARRMLFFVEGISEPQKKAKDWAIANSWNNQLKQNEYTKFAVISSKISVLDDYFLDLTTNDGMEVFNYFRGKFIDKICIHSKKRGENLFCHEGTKKNKSIF